MRITFIAPFIVCCLFISCSENKTKDTETVTTGTIKQTTDTVTSSIEQHDTSVLLLTKKILTALKNKDHATFASYFHPKGVRFSPYGHIDTTTDVELTAASFLKKINSKDNIIWGAYDGSGDPMRLTVNEYVQKFVYNADFLNAEKTAENKFIGQGNSLNNLSAVYKGLPFTESHFSGFDKKYGGMDWTSLRLVYEKLNGRYYLKAVVHDQWTS